MYFRICVMLIVSVLFLSITSVTGQIARRSLEGKEKQIMYGDDNMDEAMDIDHEGIPINRLAIINIQNSSRRPFSLICWNHRDNHERDPEFNPMETFELKFDKVSNLYWDCSVMSIDESAYTQYLTQAISKHFRAWRNSAYPPLMMQGSQSSISKPAIANVRFCNKCYWMLGDDGIFHVWGEYHKHWNNNYNFVFPWDIRGHKRGGDSLISGRHRVEIVPNYETIPIWNKEVHGDTLHFPKQMLEEYSRPFKDEIKFGNKQDNAKFDDEDGDENEDVSSF